MYQPRTCIAEVIGQSERVPGISAIVRIESNRLAIAVGCFAILLQIVICQAYIEVRLGRRSQRHRSARSLNRFVVPSKFFATEAGLRPRSRGGSGFEWFAALRLEAVQLAVQVTDPLLGQHGQTLPLLPAMPLLDWSLG